MWSTKLSRCVAWVRPFPQLGLLVPSAEVEALRVTLTLLQRLVSWVTVEKRLRNSEEGLESVVSVQVIK